MADPREVQRLDELGVPWIVRASALRLLQPDRPWGNDLALVEGLWASIPGHLLLELVPMLVAAGVPEESVALLREIADALPGHGSIEEHDLVALEEALPDLEAAMSDALPSTPLRRDWALEDHLPLLLRGPVLYLAALEGHLGKRLEGECSDRLPAPLAARGPTLAPEGVEVVLVLRYRHSFQTYERILRNELASYLTEEELDRLAFRHVSSLGPSPDAVARRAAHLLEAVRRNDPSAVARVSESFSEEGRSSLAAIEDAVRQSGLDAPEILALADAAAVVEAVTADQRAEQVLGLSELAPCVVVQGRVGLASGGFAHATAVIAASVRGEEHAPW
ncbi:MAG: hypothetical protein R3B82_09800 [Sandaracinaceae bacterium]